LPSDSSTEESLAIEEGNARQEDSGSERSSNSKKNPEQEREIPLLRRSGRTVRPKNWGPDFITFKAACDVEYDDSKTVAKAMKRPDKHL
jgi:hypothetical protein